MLELVGKVVGLVQKKGLRYMIEALAKRIFISIDYRTCLVSLFLAPYLAYRLRRMELDEALDLLLAIA